MRNGRRGELSEQEERGVYGTLARQGDTVVLSSFVNSKQGQDPL